VVREDWSSILDGFARCVRIIRSANLDNGPLTIDDGKFVEKEERDLHAAIQSSAVNRPSSVDEFLEIVTKLIPFITAFFDKVLVMAEDQAVKKNRLGLLQKIAGLASGIADLSKLEGF
jgi:glycyl-tRNA synthetase